MPWLEKTAMSLKIAFIQEAESREKSMCALCESFGISRKTGYKWLHRYRDGGVMALHDRRSDRPFRKGHYSQEVWKGIFSLRERFSTYGPRKLVKILEEQHPEEAWPSISLVKQRLREQGYSIERSRHRKFVSERLPLREITGPNDVWCMDFKGWFMTQDARRCEPLTVMDGFSRFMFVCVPLKSVSADVVRPELEKIFREYGKPRAIRSDNGPPFGSSGFRGLSPLSVWLLKQGIWPEKITPGKPGENGRLERLHRTLKGDILQGPPRDFSEYDGLFREFVQQYNMFRPHESLDDKPPASAYVPSDWKYSGTDEKYEYPSEYHKIRVNRSGYFHYKGQRVYLSESLAAEYIGICEKEDGHHLQYRSYPLGTLEQHLTRMPSYKKRQP